VSQGYLEWLETLWSRPGALTDLPPLTFSFARGSFSRIDRPVELAPQQRQKHQGNNAGPNEQTHFRGSYFSKQGHPARLPDHPSA
jgi:hypothetical protein